MYLLFLLNSIQNLCYKQVLYVGSETRQKLIVLFLPRCVLLHLIYVNFWDNFYFCILISVGFSWAMKFKQYWIFGTNNIIMDFPFNLALSFISFHFIWIHKKLNFICADSEMRNILNRKKTGTGSRECRKKSHNICYLILWHYDERFWNFRGIF